MEGNHKPASIPIEEMPGIPGVSKTEEEMARKLLEQWTELSTNMAGAKPCASEAEGSAMARSPQQLKRLRYVSCLFWVLNARSADASKMPSMHSLLKLTNTPVFDFFLQTSLLGKLADKIACFKELFPQEAASRRLKAFTTMEVHFIILVIMFSKLKKIVEELVPEESHREPLQRASWLLFLNVQHITKAFDMFPAFCLCVASLHAVLASARGMDPCSFAESDGAETPEERAARVEWSEGVLKKACAEASVVDEVRRVASKLDGRILLDSPHLVERKKILSGLSPEKSSSSASLGGAASAAEAISGVNSLPGSPMKLVRAAIARHSPSSALTADPSVFRTPERPTRPACFEPPQTPLTSMQQNHAWLSHFLHDAQRGAFDADLERFWTACSDDSATRDGVIGKTDELVHRLAVSPAVKELGKKLYYRLLRDICLKEEQRLKRSNFSALLKDAQMHCALLAICFEIVMHVHAPLVRPFPYAIRMMEVSDFEFLVMIENINLLFEQSHNQLPEGVRSHIRSLQHRIVETEAWKKGSVVLSYLAEPALASIFNKEEASIEALRNTASSRSSHHLQPPSSPARDAMKSMPPPEAFSRRFWLRARDVLAYLLTRLRSVGMSPGACHRAQSVLKLMAQAGSMAKLLPDRHLHQVLLCIIFGSCKVEMRDTSISFKAIIAEHIGAFDYTDDHNIYWKVKASSDADQEVNVIEFYNNVFIHECKAHLCVAPDLNGTEGSAHERMTVTPPQSPAHKLAKVRKVSISPISQERGYNIEMNVTPRTSRLFTFELASIGLTSELSTSQLLAAALQDEGSLNTKRLAGAKRRLAELADSATSPQSTLGRPPKSPAPAKGARPSAPAASPQTKATKFGEPPC